MAQSTGTTGALGQSQDANQNQQYYQQQWTGASNTNQYYNSANYYAGYNATYQQQPQASNYYYSPMGIPGHQNATAPGSYQSYPASSTPAGATATNQPYSTGTNNSQQAPSPKPNTMFQSYVHSTTSSGPVQYNTQSGVPPPSYSTGPNNFQPMGGQNYYQTSSTGNNYQSNMNPSGQGFQMVPPPNKPLLSGTPGYRPPYVTNQYQSSSSMGNRAPAPGISGYMPTSTHSSSTYQNSTYPQNDKFDSNNSTNINNAPYKPAPGLNTSGWSVDRKGSGSQPPPPGTNPYKWSAGGLNSHSDKTPHDFQGSGNFQQTPGQNRYKWKAGGSNDGPNQKLDQGDPGSYCHAPGPNPPRWAPHPDRPPSPPGPPPIHRNSSQEPDAQNNEYRNPRGQFKGEERRGGRGGRYQGRNPHFNPNRNHSLQEEDQQYQNQRGRFQQGTDYGEGFDQNRDGRFPSSHHQEVRNPPFISRKGQNQNRKRHAESFNPDGDYDDNERYHDDFESDQRVVVIEENSSTSRPNTAQRIKKSTVSDLWAKGISENNQKMLNSRRDYEWAPEEHGYSYDDGSNAVYDDEGNESDNGVEGDEADDPSGSSQPQAVEIAKPVLNEEEYAELMQNEKTHGIKKLRLLALKTLDRPEKLAIAKICNSRNQTCNLGIRYRYDKALASKSGVMAVCHLIFDGFIAATGAGDTKVQAKRNSFETALQKIYLPHLRIVRGNGNYAELQASLRPFPHGPAVTLFEKVPLAQCFSDNPRTYTKYKPKKRGAIKKRKV